LSKIGVVVDRKALEELEKRPKYAKAFEAFWDADRIKKITLQLKNPKTLNEKARKQVKQLLARQALSLSKHNFDALKQAAADGEVQQAMWLNYVYTSKSIEALQENFERSSGRHCCKCHDSHSSIESLESHWTKLTKYLTIPVKTTQFDCFKMELRKSEYPVEKVLNFTTETLFVKWLGVSLWDPIDNWIDNIYFSEESAKRKVYDVDKTEVIKLVVVHIAGFLFPNPTNQLQRRIEVALDELGYDKNEVSVHPGPPKTVERCQNKADEYKADWAEINSRRELDQKVEHDPKLLGLVQKAKILELALDRSLFQMSILDLVRVSLTCQTPKILINCVNKLKDIGELRGVKNGFSLNHFKESGYRDVKILVEVVFSEFDVAYFLTNGKHLPLGNGNGNFRMIVEIQFLLPEWSEAKKQSGLVYKLRRARDKIALYRDFKKYL